MFACASTSSVTLILVAQRLHSLEYMMLEALDYKVNILTAGMYSCASWRATRNSAASVVSPRVYVHDLHFSRKHCIQYCCSRVCPIPAAHFAPPFLIACGDIEMKVDSEGSTASLVADVSCACMRASSILRGHAQHPLRAGMPYSFVRVRVYTRAYHSKVDDEMYKSLCIYVYTN